MKSIQNILILAQSNVLAIEAESYFSKKANFSKVYPGAKALPSNFDGLIIYISDSIDINMLKDLL